MYSTSQYVSPHYASRGRARAPRQVMTELGMSNLGYSVHARAPTNPYSGGHYSGGYATLHSVGSTQFTEIHDYC